MMILFSHRWSRYLKYWCLVYFFYSYDKAPWPWTHERKEFIGASSSRVWVHDYEGKKHGGRQACIPFEQLLRAYTVIHKQEAERVCTNWEWPDLLKPESPCPGDISLLAMPYLLKNSQFATKLSNICLKCKQIDASDSNHRNWYCVRMKIPVFGAWINRSLFSLSEDIKSGKC